MSCSSRLRVDWKGRNVPSGVVTIGVGHGHDDDFAGIDKKSEVGVEVGFGVRAKGT